MHLGRTGPLPAGLTLALWLLGSSAAHASQHKIMTYRLEVIWSTAIRFIRADRGYPIEDRDKQAGYILFIYPGQGAVKKCPASLEIFRVKDERGFERVRVQLEIRHQPSYVAQHLLDRLEEKLRDERGAPPPPRRPPEDEPPKAPPPKDEDKNKDHREQKPTPKTGI